MPLEDDAEDDASPFGTPLPPDDRLWRHPSELGWEDRVQPPRRPGIRPWLLAAASALIGAGLALVVVNTTDSFGTGPGENRVVERVAVRSAGIDPVTGLGRSGGVATIVESVRPSVVGLELGRAGGRTIGSGVIFRDDGYVLTSAQLVEGLDDVVVVLDDGRELEGEVVGRDAVTDVAVLKIEGDDFEPAVLGRAADLRVGDAAIVVGTPTGLQGGPTATVGFVTALGRRIDSPAGTVLHDLIQTDSPIPPGASGGALVDDSGVVIGISTLLSLNEDMADDSGFAVPIDLAQEVAEEIIATGRARHVWIGIEGTDVEEGGAIAMRVVEDGPAAAGGLRDGDVVVAVDGSPVLSMSELIVALRNYEPGDVIRVEYVRDREVLSTEITLGERAG